MAIGGRADRERDAIDGRGDVDGVTAKTGVFDVDAADTGIGVGAVGLGQRHLGWVSVAVTPAANNVMLPVRVAPV